MIHRVPSLLRVLVHTTLHEVCELQICTSLVDWPIFVRGRHRGLHEVPNVRMIYTSSILEEISYTEHTRTVLVAACFITTSSPIERELTQTHTHTTSSPQGTTAVTAAVIYVLVHSLCSTITKRSRGTLMLTRYARTPWRR